MFRADKIIEKATARLDAVSVDAERCTRMRSSLSKCTKCTDVCTEVGIDINKSSIQLNYNCIQCGLCAAVCPTGALSIQEPTELSLYDHASALEKDGKDCVISCKQNDDVSNDVFKVPCLGSLTIELLFSLDLLSNKVYMILCENKCGKCKVKHGMSHYYGRIKEVDEIKSKLGLRGGALTDAEHPPELKYKKIHSEKMDEERREFIFSAFKLFEKTIKNIPDAAVEYILGEEEESKLVSSVDKIEKYPIFVKAFERIEKCNIINGEVNEYFKPFLAGECKFCKACSILCPTGALKCTKTHDTINIVLFPNACCGCNLCVEVCYHNALSLKTKKAEDFMGDSPYTIARGVVQKCIFCGKEIYSGKKEEICQSCLKMGKKIR